MAKGHRSQIKRERNAVRDERPKATLGNARVSSRKACFVLDAIRGKDVESALAILTYNPRYASSLIRKLLESAIANAENNSGLDASKLYVAECYANQGPTLKRIHPRAQGRAYRILKRTSKITLILDEQKNKPARKRTVREQQRLEYRDRKNAGKQDSRDNGGEN